MANSSMEQGNILLEFIKKNPELLTGKFSEKDTPNDAQRLWEDISRTLISCGNGANKDLRSWRMVIVNQSLKWLTHYFAFCRHGRISGPEQKVETVLT
ncbi:hypothetical protein JTB14_023239 [Gonioctena quinquepunctata]|nr:hypothetical protein JTB14_023239 [Gonioctena quinquepunctata]